MIKLVKRLCKDELERVFGTVSADSMLRCDKPDDVHLGQKMLRVLMATIEKLKPLLEQETETIDIRTEFNPEGCWRFCPRRGTVLMALEDGITLCIAPNGTLFTVRVCPREHNTGPSAIGTKSWHYFPADNNCNPRHFPFANLYAALNEKYKEIAKRRISGLTRTEEQKQIIDALLEVWEGQPSRMQSHEK